MSLSKPPSLPPPSADIPEPSTEQITAEVRKIVEGDDATAAVATPEASVDAQSEPSMEEIFASIRQIIAEDGPPSPTRPSTVADRAEVDALKTRIAYLEGRVEEQSRMLQALLKCCCNP